MALENYIDEMVRYTNGCRIGSRPMFAGFRSSSIISESLGSYSTLFQISAMLACAQRGLEEGMVNSKILILSDSQAARVSVK